MVQTKNQLNNIPIAQTDEEIDAIKLVVRIAQPQLILELGTWKGGTAALFQEMGIPEIITFDLVDLVKVKRPGISYRTKDIFSRDVSNEIKTICLESKRKLLFCDDGNKPVEFQMFVPYLNPGDWVMVHDWNNGIGEADVLATVRKEILIPLDLDESQRIRAWKCGRNQRST